VPGSADLVLFNISTVNTAQTVCLNAAQSALGLSFTSSGTVVLQGGGTNRTLTLAGSGITQQWKQGGSNTNWSTAGNW
jgi:hypothetical protein